ncbi:MAG TPA: helix-turn-helix transcriptional regulator [Terrimicrobiaceae bacterium]
MNNHLFAGCKAKKRCQPIFMRVKPLPDREVRICERIRLVRESFGRTRARMAAELGVSPSKLEHVELRRSPVRYGLAFSLSNSFSVNPVWLAIGNESPFLGVPLPTAEKFEISPHSLYSSAFETKVVPWLKLQNHPVGAVIPVDELDLSPNFECSSGGRTDAANWLRQRILALLAFVPDFWLNRFCDYVSEEAKAFIARNRAVWSAEISEVREGPSNMLRAFEEQMRLTRTTVSRSVAANESTPHSQMPKRTYAQRIASALKSAGLTQAQASEKWGINRRTLEDWKQGRSEPHGLYRERIEQILSAIERG